MTVSCRGGGGEGQLVCHMHFLLLNRHMRNNRACWLYLQSMLELAESESCALAAVLFA